MDYKISVIMPVYNSFVYLKNSFISNTLSTSATNCLFPKKTNIDVNFIKIPQLILIISNSP